MSARKVLGPFVMEEESLDMQLSAEQGLCSSAACLKRVCVLVYATLCGSNGLRSPQGKEKILKVVNYVYLKVYQSKQVFCKG